MSTRKKKKAEVSPSSSPGFPVVGIGASAGGLAAFEAFFSGMPGDTDPGVAFVLVQHLAPDHKSILSDLIRKYTRMQVFEVHEGMVVQPNCAYIIPPNRDMAFLNGVLHLLETSAPRGPRLTIDFFFRSLAQDQGSKAIGVILSGTGSDGALGVRAIKGEGGMVLAQSPDSTEFDGMPRSAIATGLVDYVLPPAEMPGQLLQYIKHAFGKRQRSTIAAAPEAENELQKIFILLRAQTGHDFSHYKASTMKRRIERRLAVHQIDRLDDYVKYLQSTPVETEALFRDLLIGVTNFFRDPEAFESLAQLVIPKIFASKPPGSLVRVWSAGCSTGEEAYSIAILMQEHLESLKQGYQVQVFATDIDEQAIALARAGIYPVSIAADLSPERLNRFFTSEHQGASYRIHKGIRDMLIFSEHDVIKDPPFSKLDLIICRNLLIYLDVDLQKKLIPLFHYALKPGGMLFLGSSETLGSFAEMFTAMDRKVKVFQRKENHTSPPGSMLGRFLPSHTVKEEPVFHRSKEAFAGKSSVRELTEQALVRLLVPPCALVNSQGDIHYLHGRTGRYFEPAPGEAAVNNVLKMAREGLRHELSSALHKAVVSKESVFRPGLSVKTNGDFSPVDLKVFPVVLDGATTDSVLYLVVLEEGDTLPTQTTPTVAGETSEADARIALLEKELQAKDECLQATHEVLETANEELKSSNEEMQSINEELQSTNEELETSKEELQSLNEELSTVNAELQAKVSVLSQANNDMNNLLASTNIATVFLDIHLCILRFTPATTRIISLIPSDIGRPVGHMAPLLVGYTRLLEDVQQVLDTLVPVKREVQSRAGAWYAMIIQPYRTLDNIIQGTVVTFVDITEIKRTEAALRETQRILQLALPLSQGGQQPHEPFSGPMVWTFGSDGGCDYVSSQWLEFTGLAEAQLLQMRWLNQVHPEDVPEVKEAWKRAHETGDSFQIDCRFRQSSGQYHFLETRAVPMRDQQNRVVKWLAISLEKSQLGRC